MVMIPPISSGGVAGGGSAGSVLEASREVGRMRYPGLDGHDGWDDEGSTVSGTRDATRDGSRSGTRGPPADNDGFTVQGKLFDPILTQPMAVSAETHADFWEDDMDYSESVVTDGSETRADSRTETDDKTCQGCPPEGKVAPMVRRCGRWSEVTISYQTRICGTSITRKRSRSRSLNTATCRSTAGNECCASSGRQRRGTISFSGKMEPGNNGGKDIEALLIKPDDIRW